MNIWMAALSGSPGLGGKTIRALTAVFGTAEAVWRASAESIRETRLLSEKKCVDFLDYRRQTDPHAMGEAMFRAGIRCCTWKDESYPSLLKTIANPPAILFYKGEAPLWEKSIGIVGARKSTAYGAQTARRLGEELARADVAVVSGGARGIDSAAHEGCLTGKGRTVMVAAFGLDLVYPPENRRLFCRIVEEGGTLVSEYPPGTPPLGRQFPARNRIIAGMSRGLVVVEAGNRSGALITADFALEEGRDVFAVPGNIWSAESVGVNRLIRSGAICCTGASDILSEYGWDKGKEGESESTVPELTGEEELVYRFCCIGDEASDEDMLQQSGLAVTKLTEALLRLQLKGYIRESAPGRFIRTGKA